MTKKNKKPLSIFIEAIGLYFTNFIQFMKYMTFPVLGQILGLSIILACTFVYSKNLPSLIDKYAMFNDFNTLVLFSVIISIPGMIIFIKAFWEYLVAYGAINSMLDNMLKSGKLYDFRAHTELIKRRTPSFVTLWLILGVFSIFAAFPLLWVPAGVVAVYLALVFQVFTFEPELSPAGCIKKSFNLIKGHFASTFLLMFLSGLICWIFIPQIFNSLFDICGINKFFSNVITPLINMLPLNDINSWLSMYHLPLLKQENITILVVTSFVSQIIIQYTLPMRSILCGLWYKELNGNLPAAKIEKKKSFKTRPSEKLMEESHKRLDKNILKRAMEKED